MKPMMLVFLMQQIDYMIQISHVCDCDGQGQAETPLRWQRLRLPEAALRHISKQETAIILTDYTT